MSNLENKLLIRTHIDPISMSKLSHKEGKSFIKSMMELSDEPDSVEDEALQLCKLGEMMLDFEELELSSTVGNTAVSDYKPPYIDENGDVIAVPFYYNDDFVNEIFCTYLEGREFVD